MANEGDIFYYDRRKKEMVREEVLGDKLLRLAYLSPFRGALRGLLFGNACLSRLIGWYANRSWSAKRIDATVRQLGIDMDEVEIPDGGFRSFNEFFCRRLKPGSRVFDNAPARLSSPADCRIRIWNRIDHDLCIPVKGHDMAVSELLGEDGKRFTPRFLNGSLCVCRLCPADYHRFHFPADGKVLATWRIPGNYHSVNPIALNLGINVFGQNVREVTILELVEFGLCAFIEVGAFGVASITQTYSGRFFSKGTEKGYFTFGGSTIIMIFEPDRIAFSEDLTEYSAKDMEVLVKCGDTIAELQ